MKYKNRKGRSESKYHKKKTAAECGLESGYGIKFFFF